MSLQHDFATELLEAMRAYRAANPEPVNQSLFMELFPHMSRLADPATREQALVAILAIGMLSEAVPDPSDALYHTFKQGKIRLPDGAVPDELHLESQLLMLFQCYGVFAEATVKEISLPVQVSEMFLRAVLAWWCWLRFGKKGL